MARTEKVKGKCRDCAERKRNDEGKLYCPHLECISGEVELNFWRNVGGATLIDPKEG